MRGANHKINKFYIQDHTIILNLSVFEEDPIILKMAQTIATPRILPGHLHAFAPSAHPSTSTVRLLGTISTVSGDQATLTCGNEAVTILLNRSTSHSLPHP